jgi:hypothetical protein
MIPWQIFALWERARNEARRRQDLADLERLEASRASRDLCTYRPDSTTAPTSRATNT